MPEGFIDVILWVSVTLNIRFGKNDGVDTCTPSPDESRHQKKSQEKKGEDIGGEGGIRTLDTLLTYTRFPGVRLKPLGHLTR